jgi:hypothetical protein
MPWATTATIAVTTMASALCAIDHVAKKGERSEVAGITLYMIVIAAMLSAGQMTDASTVLIV